MLAVGELLYDPLIHRHVLLSGFDGESGMQCRRRPDHELATVLAFGEGAREAGPFLGPLGDVFVDGVLDGGDRVPHRRRALP
ncbi:hypothetical protein A5707_18820 [Mycobacterium kyorinense]|uniref:Uncharacterized protein n=1 Tax=Mycobacterium kyorinense TaxID=487514 RepID=A0A1A2ZDS9_9MYCO|nr:hypothetical protein A5707_18820 [Mycobacterium kyorinense]